MEEAQLTPSKKKSLAWQHFKVDSNDVRIATCLLCQKIVKRGKTAEESLLGTTALLKHLKQYHTETSKVVEKDVADKKEAQLAKKRKLDEQYGIVESFNALQKWADDGEKAKQITKLIGKMMIVDH